MKSIIFIVLILLPLLTKAQAEVSQPIEPVEIDLNENVQITKKPFSEFTQVHEENR